MSTEHTEDTEVNSANSAVQKSSFRVFGVFRGPPFSRLDAFWSSLNNESFANDHLLCQGCLANTVDMSTEHTEDTEVNSANSAVQKSSFRVFSVFRGPLPF